MKSLFDDTPEDLAALRFSVDDWLEKAQGAVWSFYVPENGSFMRDSSVDPSHTSLTTTARCYMALACATREVAESRDVSAGGWQQCAQKFFNGLQLVVHKREVLEPSAEDDGPDKALNNFELAHLSDFVFLRKLRERFSDGAEKTGIDLNWPANIKDDIEKTLKSRLQENLSLKDSKKNSNANMSDGQTYFDERNPASKHFFVTLHTLRALAILEPNKGQRAGPIDDIVAHAKHFCVEQCFYTHRSNRHSQDPARLAFAGVILCLYGGGVEDDLACAFIEALASCQQESGTWSTTHPIIRGDDRNPWYIANHEIALCLTWLYFQPHIPDSARATLLDMMEKYFKKWVIPTFRLAKGARGKSFSGWYDDSAAGQERVVGWASSIVCHFLTNYRTVLNDHLNRRVIEELQLQASSKRYLIDATKHDANPKWMVYKSGKATWPDLPPISWMPKAEATPLYLGRQISWNWTDPTKQSKLSKALARKVLAPILNSVQQRPPDIVSGIFDGPPGTRKTSLVKTVSELMRWPYIAVPASVIFENGFDLMEARANEVFRRLNYLTQCVIFFDEFEEFFRKRPEEPSDADEPNYGPKLPSKDDKSETEGADHKAGISENRPELKVDATDCLAGRATIHDRTIAAFTTSAMLPRLQELRDQENCLIFLATNHIEKIDLAIIRPGRFDFNDSINHPLLVDRFLAGDGKSYLDSLTARTLKDIGVHTNEQSMKPVDEKHLERLTIIVRAVRRALGEQSIIDDIRKIGVQRAFGNPEAKKKPIEEDDAFLDDGLAWVRFSFVEGILNNIAEYLDSKGEGLDSEQLDKFADRTIRKKSKDLKESNKPVSLLSD